VACNFNCRTKLSPRWTWSCDSASTGISHMSTGLLQLSFSISLTVDTEPLQRVQNAVARMIFNLRRHKHVTPCQSGSQYNWMRHGVTSTSTLQNNLLALHSDAQHPSYEMSSVHVICATSCSLPSPDRHVPVRVLTQIRRATSHRGWVPNSESASSSSVHRHGTLYPLIYELFQISPILRTNWKPIF